MMESAGAFRKRLPTLAALIAAALFFAMLTLVAMPPPQTDARKYSLRGLPGHGLAAMDGADRPQEQPEAGAGPGEDADAMAADVLAQRRDGPIGLQPMERKPPRAETEEHADSSLHKGVLRRPDSAAIILPPAPDPAIAERTPNGILPMIAGDGRRPWQVYARPFDERNQPHVVIVLAGLGPDRAVANAAIDQLPGSITLAFDAQWAARDDMMNRARAAGHETLLSIPAEPFDYPNSDPGPDTLLTGLAEKENLRRLRHFMMQGAGYVGVMTLSGTRFVSVPKALQLLLDEAQHRGLALLDTKITDRDGLAAKAARMRLPVAAIDYRIGSDMPVDVIDQILAQAARTAKQSGQAICLVMATPAVIDRLNRWLVDLPNSGVFIAPFTSVLW